MERRAVHVEGIVQGVGFRPFVFALAQRLGLAGFVKNQSGKVLIEVEGEPAALNRFVDSLTRQLPPLALIERLAWEPRPALGERDFRIESSDREAAGAVFVSPDVATCDDCLRELFDPGDRRFGYPFLNCTNCGPRLTIITGAPYDRPRTTMAAFPMCPACRAEYDNPADRRFHAQPTACAVCGPRLELRGSSGEPMASDPLAKFVATLRVGKIGALKGLGGYHLACDAGNAAAVAELRRRKHRDEKPFAVMVADAVAAEALCEVADAERALLISPQRPIVLLRKRPMSAVVHEVAPGNPWLGVMLPYTPLHHLLLRAARTPLVMTSGNRSDEPIAYGDDDALARLAGIADVFLLHNRPIALRCDDSVTRVVDGAELPVRRSRGYAPRPIALPFDCPQPILAVGGQLKATFALGRGSLAFLSHHAGDLDYYDAYQAFVRDIGLYEQLLDIRPACLVHDLHPDYASTRYAQARADAQGSALVCVQHHHAHLASCMAEHCLSGPVIGVTFDGTGYGTDGAVWGGEFLVGDYRQFLRAGHFRYVGMPGGEQAIREPWRMAVAHLADAGVQHGPLGARISQADETTVRRMLERSFRTPATSSVGRLFDAVASLAGVADCVSYEGQAAMQLEALATGVPPAGAYPFAVEAAAPLVIDTRPLIAAVAAEAVRDVAPALIARRFHTTLADIVVDVCNRVRTATSVATVVLSGGVFQNALLSAEVRTRLSASGFVVYRHCLVPPNDGGLSLGQLAVAAARMTAVVPREPQRGGGDLPRT